MIIKKIEKYRFKNLKKKTINFIKNITFIRGDFISIWYINREREKGNIKYQVTKGLCIDVRYNGYNSSFLLRSIIKNIVFEQIYQYYSLNNIYLIIKKNTIKFYIKNKLIYLRKKKINKVKWLIKYKINYNFKLWKYQVA